MPTSQSTITWLLEGPAWLRYCVRRDLLNQDEADAEVRAARREMVRAPEVKSLLRELAAWPGPAITSHRSAGHLLHKLTFLADLGLTVDDPGVPAITRRILKHQSPEGAFQVLMNIPKHFGGTGQDELAWALCDAPLVLYALARFGLGADARVQTAARHLAGLVEENGWRCKVSPQLGRFRGPGRKDDPCPYANLVALKALACFPDHRAGPAGRAGVETALQLWAERRERHPYMFFMGTDFCKLKAPLVWYDILHVATVLSRFPGFRRDPRSKDLLAILQGKLSADGLCTPESVWQAWKDWEFSRKQSPSRWLTFLVHAALRP